MAAPESPIEPALRVPAPREPGDGTEPPSALQRVLPYLARMLHREPALAITLGYVFVAVAGIFYDERYYAKFGIPVLTLSQIGDFLVAGVQQPVALVLLVSTVPLCWVFDYFNVRSRRRHARERAELVARAPLSAWQRLRLRFLDWRVQQVWYTQLSYVGAVIAYGWMFVTFYADHRAAAVRQGDVAEVRVWLNGQSDALYGSRGQVWSYLGAVANYVFVYDRDAAHSVILPVNNIVRIEPVKSTGEPSGHPLVVPIL